MYEGHIEPVPILRHCAVPLHSSIALMNDPWRPKSSFVGTAPPWRSGLTRRSVSMRAGWTMTPGFSRPSGSHAALSSANAPMSCGPYIRSRNSERDRPSPCSPESDPPSSMTRSATRSAMRRIRATSPGSRVSSAGRMCRQPTDACP